MTDPVWIKSSLSYANGNCVEVSDQPEGTIGVRNSRDGEGPVLRFTPGEWQAFRHVFFPLSLPGVYGAGLLAFILALGFYVTPALLGGGKTVMIAEYIALQITDTLNWGLATALATALLAAVLAILAAAARVVDLRQVFGVK